MSISTTSSIEENDSLHQDASIRLRRATVATPYGDIAYAESGAGPVALFIHGVFMNADLWRGQLAALGDLRRCVAIDLLGHGDSACPAGVEYSLATQVEVVTKFLDALGVAEADVVANDTGGALAQLFAVRAPGRLRTLTLTNCEADENIPPAAFQPIVDMARAGALAEGLPALAADPEQGRVAMSGSLEHPEALPDELVSGFLGPFTDPERARAVQELVAGMDSSVTVAIRDDLARLEVPTAIVWGTGDEFFDVSWARWLAGTIPGTRQLRTIEGAKLFHPLERPDELNGVLRELWAPRPAPAA